MADGRGHLDWFPKITETTQPSQKVQALEDFVILITNPQWSLLAGPCIRCGDYFLKKTKRGKTYCSKDCSSRATALPTMQRKRQQERSEKLEQAQNAIDKWGEKKRRISWKKWVSMETRFTTNWITRAVNKRDLVPPGGAVH